MAQYINKDALIAKIEKCYNECLEKAKITDPDYWNAKADAYRIVLLTLDNIREVKEVDLKKEIKANTDKFKWVILDENKAKELHIKLIKITEDKAMLAVDIAFIPRHTAIIDYLEWIEESGIALNESIQKSNEQSGKST